MPCISLLDIDTGTLLLISVNNNPLDTFVPSSVTLPINPFELTIVLFSSNPWNVPALINIEEKYLLDESVNISAAMLLRASYLINPNSFSYTFTFCLKIESS